MLPGERDVDQPYNPESTGRATKPRAILPHAIFGYVWRVSGRHQILLALLSIIVFLLSAIPLELQRRIVNDAIHAGAIAPIAWLALGYAGVALAEGAFKLALNMYRGWVSENAVRHLRKTIHALADELPGEYHAPDVEGVEVSMILSEAEPIGGFVGISMSEPLLQGGVLLSVFGYMLYLQPEIALVSLVVFSPQLIFVPLMQHAINRRVHERIQILRDVSGGLIEAAHNHDGRHGAQGGRIDRIFTLNMGIYKLKFSMNFLMNLMHHLGIAAVLAVGGWYAVTGRVEVGTVVAFISGLAKVNDPWGDLVNWFREMTVSGVKYRLLADAVERLARIPRVEPGKASASAAPSGTGSMLAGDPPTREQV
jgi:ABC-type multidrug transport system fused ATPase/permease subunit